MSLLRDALKKAERAQEEARQDAGPQDLVLEPRPAFAPLVMETVADAAAADDRPPIETHPPIDGAQPVQAKPSGAKAPAPAEPLPEPAPKRTFHATLAALAAVGLGIGGYFWLQLRSPSPVAHSTAQRVSHGQAVPSKPAASGPLMASVEQALASLPVPVAISESPGETQPHPAEKPASPPPERKAKVPPIPKENVVRFDTAPADMAPAPPPELETAATHSSLGNQHARGGRWREAQQAFARALAEDPQNADFAFNLAVSLDRLGHVREARERYQQALLLRQSQPANFPAAAARERMLHLAR